MLVLAALSRGEAVQPPKLTNLTAVPVELVLHVAADAKPDGDGSVDRPFARVQRAIDAAQKSRRSARVLIGPGIYRETVDIVGTPGSAPPLLVIEAAEAGTAVISGSDLFDEWTELPGVGGRYRHVWKLKRGWESNPWPGLMPMDTPGFRHELLFVDGRPLRQVFGAQDLVPGSYWVDEDGAQIVLATADGRPPRPGTVEVSVRPLAKQGVHSKLLRVQARDNLVLRGLVFRHAMTPAFVGALQFRGCQRVLIEDVRAEWNGGVGIGFDPVDKRVCQDFVLRRVRADHNGFMGMSGSFHDALLEDCTTDGNNWRGAAVGATGWAPCGWKFSHLERVVIRRHRAVGNHASGGWLDDEIRHVFIEDFVGMNNLRSGLSVEAVDGPLVITRALIAGNSTGLNLFDSRNTVLLDSTLLDNTTAQIRLAGSTPMEPAALAKVTPNWRKVRLAKRQVPTGIVLARNVVGVTGAAPREARLISLSMRENAYVLPTGERPLAKLVESLAIDGMVYAHPGGGEAAAFSTLENTFQNFAQWRKLTGQEQDSRFDEERLRQARAALESAVGLKIEPYSADRLPTSKASSRADALEL